MQHFSKSCRKIVCVGRNFAEHAKELNNPVPKSVMVFLKPPSSFLAPGDGSIEVPPGCTNLHHEVELGVVISGSGRDIPRSEVGKYIKGYFVGLDMTAREIQTVAKTNGLPWSVAKGMDTFAPVSELIPANKVTSQNNVELWLKVNGVEKQRGNTKDMIFDIPALVSYISTVFKLEDGDCIFTGTPAGVGAVKSGDVISAGVINKDTEEELATITFDVVERKPAANL